MMPRGHAKIIANTKMRTRLYVLARSGRNPDDAVQFWVAMYDCIALGLAAVVD